MSDILVVELGQELQLILHHFGFDTYSDNGIVTELKGDNWIYYSMSESLKNIVLVLTHTEDDMIVWRFGRKSISRPRMT